MARKHPEKRRPQVQQVAEKRPGLPFWAQPFDTQNYPAWLRWGGVALALGVSVVLTWNLKLHYFLLLGVCIIVPLERVFARHAQPILRPGILTDIMHLYVSVVIYAAPAYVVSFLAYAFRFQAISDPIDAQRQWVQYVEIYFLWEFLVYWAHRLSHKIPLLWRFHSIHHSSHHMDWLAARRRHPVDAFFVAVFAGVPMGMIGFRPEEIVAIVGLTGLSDTIIHANLNWRLRWLDGIWVTPEFHHWHHVKERAIHDNNYGGSIAIYDVLFRSFHMPKDERPEDYGIHEPMPENYLGQLAQPLLPRGRSFGDE